MKKYIHLKYLSKKVANMKVRKGFVSNSSSSSFIMFVNNNDKEISEKEFKDKYNSHFIKLFDDLHKKLETSNEVATVKNIRLESDALRTRCLNEISEYERIIAKEAKAKYEAENKNANNKTNTEDPAIEPVPVPKTKKYKNLSLRTMTRGKTVAIEKAEDVDHFLASLKIQILKELEEDTIISLSL